MNGNIIVVACGAINSAALLLRSRSVGFAQSSNDRHPNGLANSSDLVGRNLMKHICTALVQLSLKINTPNNLAASDRLIERLS